MQGRVASGASGQQKVANYFKSKHNDTIISVATPGSNTTDIVLTIKNKKYHVEVKGAESLLNEVYVFDVSSSRSNTNFDFLNELARSMLVASGKKLPKGKNVGKDLTEKNSFAFKQETLYRIYSFCYIGTFFFFKEPVVSKVNNNFFLLFRSELIYVKKLYIL